MKNFKLILSACVGVLIALFAFVGFHGQDNAPASLGSVVAGQGYYSTTTNSTWGGNKKVIKTGQGMLGSVVITVPDAAGTFFNLYDATSTTDVSSTTLAMFSTSQTRATYTFDVEISRGLIIDASPSYAGNYTITWR